MGPDRRGEGAQGAEHRGEGEHRGELGAAVYLDLGVKVKEGWRSDDAMLEDLGLDDPNRLEQPALGPAPDIVA